MKLALVQRSRKDRSGPRPIYVRLSHQRKERLVSLVVAVPPKAWNARRQEVRGSHPDAAALNTLLQARLAAAQAAAHEALLTAGRDVPIDDLKAAIVAVLHPEHEEAVPPPPIVPWMHREVRVHYRERGQISTALAYGSVLANLETSLAAQGIRPRQVTAVALTLPVLQAHRTRLSRPEADGGAGHKPNYVHKQITTLRALLRRAVRAKVPGARAALEAAELVEVRREKPERARLPIAEVRRYYDMALPGRAADVRDWWCFSFFAGG
ncbi:MAG: Arm DNA-binding domain-containing protein, partial [Bacteroidota bacterium]